VDGAANAALIEVLALYLSKTLNKKIRKSDIEIIKGLSSKIKTVKVNF